MDRDLLRQSLLFHGHSLFNTLKCEQTENPDFQTLLTDLDQALRESDLGEPSEPLVEQFIARKADLLFSCGWKSPTVKEEEPEEEAAEPYAIMPPMELFMEVSHDQRRSFLYRDLEKGDMVIGRISNIRDYGFFLKVICMAGGLKRDIEDLELSALCHISEIPSTSSHDDPLSYYQIGDLVRVGVKDIDRYEEKITVSLRPASLAPTWKHVKLGVVTREELPVQYSRSISAAANPTETYERILVGCHGYHNPSVVDYLLDKFGVSDTQPPSMMRGLQSKLFLQEDFAASIRKKQSTSWALKCVRAGVNHFKHGSHVEAMNEYNKALEIDTNNVEALVARGALYANKGSIMKAITDFELALENCPDHRNAKKYLCQTLVERGRQLEGQDKLVTAEGLYRRALSLDDSNPEAKEALNKITDTIQKSIRLREEALSKESVRAKSSQSSADKLRKILKEERRMKKKRKRSTSSTSSSLSSSSSSSSSPHSQSSRRRSKKKKKKERRSERAAKRHWQISSRESRRSQESRKEEVEEEWLPAPPNTSATFLHHTGGSMFGVMSEEEAGPRKQDGGGACQLDSAWAPSDQEPSESSYGESRRREAKENKTRSSLDTGHTSGGGAGGCSSGCDAKLKSSSLGGSEQPWRSTWTAGAPKTQEQKRRGQWSVGVASEGSRHSHRGRPQEHSSTSCMEGAPETSGGQRDANSSVKKDVPAHLMDIFNQIAEFKKEKEGRAKK